MKQAANNILALVCLPLLLASCQQQEGAMWGTAYYHPKFLWSDEVVKPVEKTIEFDFSEDAKNDQSTSAEFQFTDDKGSPISTKEMRVTMDGKELADNKFVVSSNTASTHAIRVYFTRHAKGGKHRGKLRMTSHTNLDRLDNKPLQEGEAVDAGAWSIYYDKRMNPLARALLYAAAALMALLLLTRCICRQCHPCFKRCKKTLIVKQNGKTVWQKTINLTGKRRVVLTSKAHKQPLINKIFTGTILYMKHPVFQNDLIMTPSRNDILVTGQGYTASPNPMPRSGRATIHNKAKNIDITTY